MHSTLLRALLILTPTFVVVVTALGQEIRFDGSTFRVVEWDAVTQAGNLAAEDQSLLFSVYVESPGPRAGLSLPAVIGSYRVEGEAFIFQPRYPPAPGVSYRTVFNPGAAGLSGLPLTLSFDVPRPEAPPTVVEHVFPSTDVLPENQLKLYVHFSAAMGRGDAYRHIRLLNESGDEVELAFLELDQELWTRDFRRFTILFDPGRIKTGLVPNLEEGRALVPGRTYTLVIDSAWRDANGQPLQSAYRKTFRAGPFDDVAPDIATWRLGAPDVGTIDAVTVEFPEPMDRGLMDGLIAVLDSRGEPVPGSVAVDRDETRWKFVPAIPWEAGDYRLVAGTGLEDLAGNALNGLFEVDVFEVEQTEPVGATESLPFSIR